MDRAPRLGLGSRAGLRGRLGVLVVGRGVCRLGAARLLGAPRLDRWTVLRRLLRSWLLDVRELQKHQRTAHPPLRGTDRYGPRRPTPRDRRRSRPARGSEAHRRISGLARARSSRSRQRPVGPHEPGKHRSTPRPEARGSPRPAEAAAVAGGSRRAHAEKRPLRGHAEGHRRRAEHRPAHDLSEIAPDSGRPARRLTGFGSPRNEGRRPRPLSKDVAAP